MVYRIGKATNVAACGNQLKADGVVPQSAPYKTLDVLRKWEPRNERI